MGPTLVLVPPLSPLEIQPATHPHACLWPAGETGLRGGGALVSAAPDSRGGDDDDDGGWANDREDTTT